MKFTCPQCSHEFSGSLVAKVSDEEHLTLEMTKRDGEMFDAATISGVIEDTAKALKLTAKSLGSDVTVFVSNVVFAERKASISFVIALNQGKKRKGKR